MKKILLLHGWNYTNYTSMTESKDAWENRKAFVDELSKKYEVYKLNFPGFCGEPEQSKPMFLKDYANYVFEYLKKNKLQVDYILGYSFGGAVAIVYNTLKDPNQKLILISPAIARTGVTPKLPAKGLKKIAKDFYLKNIVKNKYMVHGTKFLNDSYQNIVRVELIDEVNRISPDLLTIIYGNKDNMVNPFYVIDHLDEEHKECIHMIDGGDHDIANTHTKDILSIINNI
jgi:pimeloyl-ACP methyl ester carboxylesterase